MRAGSNVEDVSVFGSNPLMSSAVKAATASTVSGPAAAARGLDVYARNPTKNVYPTRTGAGKVTIIPIPADKIQNPKAKP